MKKLVTSLLTICLAFSCCACGGENSSGSSDAIASSVKAADSEVAGAATETDPEETVDRSQFKIKSFNTEPTIEETVLVDESGVKITATGIEYGNYKAELGLKIENSTDTEIDIGGNGAMIVNNFTIPAWISYNIPANEELEDTINIDIDELKLRGIYEIANMELHLTIDSIDADHQFNDLLDTNVNIQTSIADTYVADDMSFQKSISDPQTADQYGYEVLNWNTDTIFDQYGVQFTSVALLKNSDDERYMLIEIVNTNDTAIEVYLRNMNISGKNVVDGAISSVDIFEQSRGIITIKLDRDIEHYLEDDNSVDATYFNDFSEINFEVNVYTVQDTIIKDEPLALSFS